MSTLLRIQTTRFEAWLPLFLLVALCTAGIKADVIYSDFGPSNTYDFCSSLGVFGPASILGLAETAARFTPSANFELTQIDVALSVDNFSPSNLIMLTLNSDASGLPGGLLASWSLKDLPPLGS